MESFKDLLKLQGNELDIGEDIEVLEALGAIRENWDTLRQSITTAEVEGVKTFIEALIKGPKGGPLVKALNALELRGDELREHLAKLGDAFQRIDKKYLELLKPVSGFDESATEKDVGLFTWDLIGAKKAGGSAAAVKKPTYAFELGAKAKLEFEAGDAWPGPETQIVDPLLRIGIEGSFEFGAKARVPFSAGSLGLGAEASRAASLDYYFDARADDALFAQSVVKRLDRLPNPLSLASVWEAFGEHDVVGAVLETEGKSAFSVDVSLADAFAFKHDVKTAVGLNFQAKVRRESTFMLRLRKIVDTSDGSMSLEVTLERLQSANRERKVELGIEADLSSLGKRLGVILEEHEGRLQEVLDEYGDYLEPGTFLRDKAAKSLREVVNGFTRDPALKAALGDVAEHALGLGDGAAGDRLVKLLEDEIVEALDGVDGAITGELDQVAAKLGAALTDKLGFVPTLEATVVAKARDAIARVRSDLDERVTSLTGPKLDQLLAKVTEAGVAAASAGKKADRALAGVREVIGRYEKAIATLKARVEDAARMKIAAKITAEKSRRREREIDAKLVFSRPSPIAQRIYGDIVRGDFDTIVRLLREPESDVSVEPGTTLAELKSTTRRVGYTAVLLGFELGAVNVFDSKTEVVMSGGKVSVVSEGTAKSIKNKPREDREVSFVDAFELTAAQETRELSIGLEISHEDERLKRKEIERVIGGFEAAALLPIGTTQRAVDTFNGWIGPGEKKRIPADIKFSLRLDAKRLERLLRLDRREGAALSSAVQSEIFGVVVNELIQSTFQDADHVTSCAQAVHAALGGSEPMPVPADVLFKYTSKVHDQLKNTSDQRRKNHLAAAAGLHARCMTLVDAFDTMGDIYTAVPRVGGDEEESEGTGETAKEAPRARRRRKRRERKRERQLQVLDDGSSWDAGRYEAAQRILNEKLEDWLKAGWSDAVRPRTIAFVGTLIALAKLDGETDSGLLTLALTRRQGDNETVILSPVSGGAV